jgi:uncharacterized protein (DUF736 family)
METKVNSGAIFKNDKKTNEKQPDYRGKVNVNGKEMEIALWLKESSKGTKYFSCSFSEPYVNESQKQVHTQIIEKDDLPF